MNTIQSVMPNGQESIQSISASQYLEHEELLTAAKHRIQSLLWYPPGKRVSAIIESGELWTIEEYEEALTRTWANLALQIGPRHAYRIRNEHPGWARVHDQLVSKIGGGLLVGLIGPRGTGKTQLAVSLCRLACELHSKEIPVSGNIHPPAVYATWPDLLAEVRATYRQGSRASDHDILRRYARVPLLVLDEVQESSGSDFDQRILTTLLDSRYRFKRDTIIVSNLDAEGFTDAIGPSVADRMRECGGVVEMVWDSFRGSMT